VQLFGVRGQGLVAWVRVCWLHIASLFRGRLCGSAMGS